MPTEAELRERFHDDDASTSGRATGARIDLDAVLRRSRIRRRPRVIAVAVVSSLAAVGIVVPLSIGVLGPQLGSTFSSSAGSAAAPNANKAPEFATQGSSAPVSAGTLNRCGATLAAPAPAPDGLVVSVTPLIAAATAREVSVTVTLTNTGPDTVTGSTSTTPSFTLSKGGQVVWVTTVDGQVGLPIDLEPGASTTFSTTFEPLVCSSQASPGTYQLSAALDVSTAGNSVLVTGPTADVTLR